MKSSEIWLINFSPSVGDEISKIRPAIIVSNDAVIGLELKIVVPLTSNSKPREWHVRINPSNNNQLKKSRLADCSQLKSVAKERFIKKIGALNISEMDQVKWAMAKILDLV
jgi:mRNA interferase MazF